RICSSFGAPSTESSTSGVVPSNDCSSHRPCGSPPAPRRQTLSTSPDQPFDIEVFYDGACPLCMREIRLLRGRDHRQRIRFVDIAAAGFDASSLGVTWEALMDRIHGRLPDGT